MTGVQSRLIWFRDRVMPLEEATVSVLSPAAQFGLNVFEGVRAYWSPQGRRLNVFRLDAHIDRMRLSARLLGLEMTQTNDDVASAIREVVEAGGFREDISLRVTLIVDGIGSWTDSGPTSLFVAPIPSTRVGTGDESVMRATVSSWRRIANDSMPPRVKTGANYISGRYAVMDARRGGYDVPILLNREGHVAESPGASVLAIRNSHLIAPEPSDGILEGITRDTLMMLAESMDIATEERSIDRSELLVVDELLLCGSAVEIRPIGSVDGVRIGTGGFGPITKSLLERYHGVVEGEVPVHDGWLYPLS